MDDLGRVRRARSGPKQRRGRSGPRFERLLPDQSLTRTIWAPRSKSAIWTTYWQGRTGQNQRERLVTNIDEAAHGHELELRDRNQDIGEDDCAMRSKTQTGPRPRRGHRWATRTICALSSTNAITTPHRR